MDIPCGRWINFDDICSSERVAAILTNHHLPLSFAHVLPIKGSDVRLVFTRVNKNTLIVANQGDAVGVFRPQYHLLYENNFETVGAKQTLCLNDQQQGAVYLDIIVEDGEIKFRLYIPQ